MSEMPEINTDRSSNTSLYLALLAILISLVGTGVSIFESRLLREQQDLMVEEKAASVWPFVELTVASGNRGLFGGYYSINVRNKGIGPALLGPVEFIVGKETVSEEGLPAVVSRIYPGIKIEPSPGSRNEGMTVLSAEGSGLLGAFKVSIDTTRWSENIPVDSLVRVNLCYCSVYGDCWMIDGEDKPMRTEDCPAKLDLR